MRNGERPPRHNGGPHSRLDLGRYLGSGIGSQTGFEGSCPASSIRRGQIAADGRKPASQLQTIQLQLLRIHFLPPRKWNSIARSPLPQYPEIPLGHHRSVSAVLEERHNTHVAASAEEVRFVSLVLNRTLGGGGKIAMVPLRSGGNGVAISWSIDIRRQAEVPL